MRGSGGALRELWEALAELQEALGELWEGLYIQKLPINRPSRRYVILIPPRDADRPGAARTQEGGWVI